MKKIIVMALVSTFMVGTLSACGKKNAPKYKSSLTDKIEMSTQS